MTWRKYQIEVKGKDKTFVFETYGHSDCYAQWVLEGLDIYPLENEIPVWVWKRKLLKIWCFLQDLLK